ncbi:hypothetical protein [Neisseria iguanae]|uniref:hypothetical protein n=1 Tax=Neisseria iguanae TaxID=90242 RepID=UPI0011B1D08C|nr:hypothetical protein [Neisseria iguanae]
MDFKQWKAAGMLGKHGFGGLFEKAAHGENPLNSITLGMSTLLGIKDAVKAKDPQGVHNAIQNFISTNITAERVTGNDAGAIDVANKRILSFIKGAHGTFNPEDPEDVAAMNALVQIDYSAIQYLTPETLNEINEFLVQARTKVRDVNATRALMQLQDLELRAQAGEGFNQEQAHGIGSLREFRGF